MMEMLSPAVYQKRWKLQYEIPLGEYVVIIEFIGYSKKEIGPLNIFPGKMVGGEGK